MNKKLTDEAIQACINVFDNSTLEEIVNLSNRLSDVWKIGKELKENIDFEEEFDYDSYVCVDGKCVQLEVNINNNTCYGCIFIDSAGDADGCNTVCPGGNKVIQFKE